jgi:hypothetical protein
MKLNDRQKKRIADIIDDNTGWLIGWCADEETERNCYKQAATDISNYLARSFRALDRRENQNG